MPFESRKLIRKQCHYPVKAPFRSGSRTTHCKREAVATGYWSDSRDSWSNWKIEMLLCKIHLRTVREREKEHDTTFQSIY